MEATLTIIILVLVSGIVATALYIIHFCKKKKCYKFVAYSSILLSALALFCSIRTSPFTISGEGAIIGVIAGVIAIPTAIVLAWQIFQSVNMIKKVEKSEHTISILKKQIVQQKIKIRQESKRNIEITRGYAVYCSSVDSLRQGGHFSVTINGLLTSIEIGIQNNEKTLVKISLDVMNGIMNQHRTNATIFQDDIKRAIRILSQIDNSILCDNNMTDDNITEIINFLKNLSTDI